MIDTNAPALPDKMIAIGFTGSLRCYLGMSREEAEKRYLAETGETDLDNLKIEEVPIIDGAFQAYEVWAID